MIPALRPALGNLTAMFKGAESHKYFADWVCFAPMQESLEFLRDSVIPHDWADPRDCFYPPPPKINIFLLSRPPRPLQTPGALFGICHFRKNTKKCKAAIAAVCPVKGNH